MRFQQSADLNDPLKSSSQRLTYLDALHVQERKCRLPTGTLQECKTNINQLRLSNVKGTASVPACVRDAESKTAPPTTSLVLIVIDE
jgi:hypothetical protein